MLSILPNSLLLNVFLATAIVSISAHAFDENEAGLSSPTSRFRRMRGIGTSSSKFNTERNLLDDSDDASYDRNVQTTQSSDPSFGIKNPTSPIAYLTRPHALAALSKLFSGRMSVPETLSDEQLEQEEVDPFVEGNTVDADADLVSFFDVGGFTQMSYGYDTAPPTMSLSESPTPAEPDRLPITQPPTTMAADENDGLVANESPVSNPPRSTSPTFEPTLGNNEDLWTNENTDSATTRPPAQDNAIDTEMPTDGVHTPSLSPTNPPTDTCFPLCSEEEICRGGKGSCYPKCKSEKRCDRGDVCRADGFCDRCRACKKKKECCSTDREVCREVVPEDKLDRCFAKCAKDEDCSTVSTAAPGPDDVCLLDGGCSKTQYRKNKIDLKKGDKYNKDKDYVAKQDKYANKNLRRLVADKNGNTYDASTRTREATRRAPRRRRMYSHDMHG